MEMIDFVERRLGQHAGNFGEGPAGDTYKIDRHEYRPEHQQKHPAAIERSQGRQETL